MKQVKIKKNEIKHLVIGVIGIEKKYENYLKEKSILDYCEIDFKASGFSITFDKNLPDNIISDLSRVFSNLGQ